MIGPLPVCFHCARLDVFPYCEAFGPDVEIPTEIASAADNHSEPFDGDHGLLFKQATLAEKYALNERNGLPRTMGTPADPTPSPLDAEHMQERYGQED